MDNFIYASLHKANPAAEHPFGIGMTIPYVAAWSMIGMEDGDQPVHYKIDAFKKGFVVVERFDGYQIIYWRPKKPAKLQKGARVAGWAKPHPKTSGGFSIRSIPIAKRLGLVGNNGRFAVGSARSKVTLGDGTVVFKIDLSPLEKGFDQTVEKGLGYTKEDPPEARSSIELLRRSVQEINSIILRENGLIKVSVSHIDGTISATMTIA